MNFPIKIIGISGGSGSGKTTLAKSLVAQLNGEALLISYDRYYLPQPYGNYDFPEALDITLLLQHLRQLAAAQAVDLPIYDRINNRRTLEVERVEPKFIVIVEGIFSLYHVELRNLYHCKVFVDTSCDIVRFQRRLARDIQERGDTEKAVIEAWNNNVLPMHYELIEPQRDRADLVVSGEAPVELGVKKVLSLLERWD
jgi:uridine kinase